MIRFALKSAFALGVASLFVPGLGSTNEDGPDIDIVRSFVGFQAAVEDILGFCTRAPDACKAGSDLSTFALGQVENGLAIAIDAAGPALLKGEGPRSTLEAAPLRSSVSQAPSQMPDLSRIDPNLLAELVAFGKAADRAGADEVSPEMIAAVRRAAELARRGGVPQAPQPAELAPRFGEEAVRASEVSSVPLPRARPGL